VKKSTSKKPVSKFEAEGEAKELEFDDARDREFWNKQGEPAAPENAAFDESEDAEYWESQTTESDTGRRQLDSTYVKGTVQARGREQLDEDLALESQAQTGGTRNPERVSTQGKQDTKSKSRTNQPIPKRSNPLTHSDYGAAENRAADEKAQGITSRSEGEEDRRQSKVVPIRNDAKAGGARTGSKKKIS